jgi:uncharacterized membrane protein YuzA (DUF378 family)
LQVIRLGKYDLIPIVVSIVGALDSTLWGLYGLVKFDAIDYKLFLPNLVGTILFLTQISVWGIYYKKSLNNHEYFLRKKDEKTNLSTDCESASISTQKLIEN